MDANNETPQDLRLPSTLSYSPLPAELSKATNQNAPSVVKVVDAPGSYPCRKCLQDGELGQQMRLISYDPWLADSPYRQHGPIFIHEEPQCSIAKIETGFFIPEQQWKRSLSIRALDKSHMMVGFDVIDGTNLIKRAEEFFAESGSRRAEYLHVHYPGPGCFAVRIDRGET